MNLYPTILTDSLEQLIKQVNQVKNNDQLSVVEIDVIDGRFADNLTVTPIDLVGVDFGNLSLNFHLMVEEPLDYVYEIEENLSNLPINGIIAQVERMSFQEEYIQKVKQLKTKVGLALDLFTPPGEIDHEVFQYLDIIQLLSVEVGAQGQKLNPRINDKIKNLTKIIQASSRRSIEIIVDGGVKLDNKDELFESGCNSIAVGSALWQAKNFDQVVDNFLS